MDESFSVSCSFCKFWTSGTLLADLKKWKWLSEGTNILFFKWLPNEPNSQYTGEKCLEVIFEMRYYTTLVWNDIPCGIDRPIICETDVLRIPRCVSAE